MDITILPGKLRGEMQIIPSKSQAHRLLICAAFADRETQMIIPTINRDIEATIGCLSQIGANIQKIENGFRIHPVTVIPKSAELNVQDSGSTLRFLLPVAGALGIDTLFHMESRLPERPLSPLWEEMERMGCTLSRPSYDTIRCTGKLKPGCYNIAGNVSSQFITGLLFAAALIPGDSKIQIIGKLESEPYVAMTQQAMRLFGMKTDAFSVHGGVPYISPDICTVEGDWSNGAFFLAANELGSSVQIMNLSSDSAQGDRAAATLLPALKDTLTIDAADIPDLVPILAVTAAAKNGAVFRNIRRLRMKESDRVVSTINMINALGGQAEADDNTLTVYGTGIEGGTVDANRDHRIAMAAAIAGTAAAAPVHILGAECVSKSYPLFFDVFRQLGGNYEQYLR